MQIFARITKVDEATGLVYGRAVQEVVDRSGEIFDYDSSKPNFEKWSTDLAKATEGKSVGNVRAMHGKVAAGKLNEITFNDVEKAVDVVAEVVDPVEREKCLKGVYTGFSIGGSYAAKWPDEVNKGVIRYTANPTEISLVDMPCVPTANFTVVKADGAEELRKFETSLDNAEGLAKWAEGLTDDERAAVLAKIAPAAPVVVATDDGVAKSLRQAFVERIAGMEKAAPIVLSLAQLAGKPLQKGMYAVADLADLLCELGWLAEDAEWEAQLEGDNSPVPAQLRESVKQLGRVLVAMATEEATELADRMGGAEKGAQVEDLKKWGQLDADALREELAKMRVERDQLATELDSLKKSQAESVEALTKAGGERTELQKALDSATGEIEKLKKQVAAPKGVARAIEKTQDNDGLGEEPPADATVRKADGSVDGEATALALIKRAHSQPIRGA
ncbi:MAG: hypothetical protein ACTHMK_13725 [Dyella sp.]|uniref:hypothetical protein n=1 Tax=Dyella sp. TaxID=1869338 RepID=UPI003F7D0ADA